VLNPHTQGPAFIEQFDPMLKTHYSPFKNKFLLAKSSEPILDLTDTHLIPDDDDEEILNLSRLSDGGGKPMTSGGYHMSA
jgi:hypothetical protein